MKTTKFQATIVSGHKGAAVEVPFDPNTEWTTPAQQIRPGRRGHPARATLNGTRFDSTIVARSRRFWLLVDDDVLAAANVQPGESVKVSVAPLKQARA